METDAAYFRRRASEEHLAASRTGPPEARRAHLDLASRYENLVRAIENREQLVVTDLDREGVGDTAPKPYERSSMWL